MTKLGTARQMPATRVGRWIMWEGGASRRMSLREYIAIKLLGRRFTVYASPWKET